MIAAGQLTRLRRRALRAFVQQWLPRDLLTLRGPSRARRIALTFDDGPDASTHAYLDLLDRFAVRATFFVVGELCAARPGDVFEIVRRGHEVAGHGYSHNELTTMSLDEIARELTATAALLPLPPPPRRRPMVRPPRGATSLRTILACAQAGFQTVLWSLDSDDCRTKDPAAIAEKVSPEHVRTGEIILLHEGQSWTLAALERILPALLDGGFAPVTLSELLEP